VKVVQQVIGKPVALGRQEATGWIPSNAAIPQPTPLVEATLDVRILEDESGFILEWRSRTGDYSNDSWHATIEEAQREAMDRFGIAVSEWNEVD
jgi:hypothetical protein